MILHVRQSDGIYFLRINTCNICVSFFIINLSAHLDRSPKEWIRTKKDEDLCNVRI